MKWTALASHRAWLLARALDLLDFFQAHSIDPDGGFFDLGDDGRPLPSGAAAATGRARHIHATTRMVHCYAIGHLMGRPGSQAIIDHGMEFLWARHRDPVHGGYFWSVGEQAPVDDTKQAYGHAFVLLAASSAKLAGHRDADRLLDDIGRVLRTRFWEPAHGAVAEEFTRDWRPLGRYRGQNSNMHLAEACMAAFEATADRAYLEMAESIANLLIGRIAADNDWRLPEHFDESWNVDREYAGSPMFRPYGTTPGHSLEWSRLLVQLWQLGGQRQAWLPDAARSLFRQAVTDGWDARNGGFYYTLNWDGAPAVRDRFWWPCMEAIGAAAVLNALDGDPLYEHWYRRVWDWSAAHLLDREHGGWRPQLNDSLMAAEGPFYGRPDIYHALQACLIPLLPTTGSITRGLIGGGIRL
jgi:mannose/cellobiose epimerase-like protein (N-acyl-D-glucosamine 2-epimerase family)